MSKIVRVTHDGQQMEVLSGVATLVRKIIIGCASGADNGFGWLVLLVGELFVSCWIDCFWVWLMR